jgi:hypothetical protein
MGWFKGLNKVFRTLDPVGKAITDKTKGKFDPIHAYQDPKQAKKDAAKKASAQAAKEASAAANLVSGGGLGLASAVGATTQAPQADPGFMDSEIFGMPAPLVVGLGVVIIGVGAYLLIKKA